MCKLLFLSAVVFLFSHVHGRIFHTTQFTKGEGNFVSTRRALLEEELKLLTRARRSLPDSDQSSSTVNELHATQFDLKNGTSHNQALIHWSGNNSKVIFVLTRKKESSYMGKITHSTLWRSTDYGETYKQENSKFDENAVLKSYYTCPIDRQKAVFVDNYQSSTRIWVTTDEGGTYHPYTIDFSLHKIEFHPTEPEWLLGYDQFSKKLWVSQNLGKTWVALHSYVTKDRFFWGVKDVENDPKSNLIVHFEYRDISVMPQRRFTVKACYIPECSDAPFQREYDELGRIDMESLNVQDKYIFVQKPGALQKLYVSYKRGPFVKSKFSGTAVEQSDFHIVSSDTGTVVVGVSHDDQACHLYFSDEKGEKFLLSKPNVRYFPRKVGDDFAVSVDIYEVKGIKGTFIMNIVGPEKQNLTEISWNNGRTWQQLSMPTFPKNPNEVICEGCNLNLHILMTQTPAGYYAPLMLSKESVPGLIIAHGSVGTTVEDLPHRFKVFMSQDAGVNWYKVLDKRHLFNLADHGAMIVGVQMMFLQPVRKLQFSNDFGRIWTSHYFSKKETINVDGLLTEPGEYTHHFTLFGHKNFHDNWKLYALDFSSLVPNHCSYPDDYHNRTMPNVTSCVLGMKQTIEVLKEDAKCMVGREYKRYTKVTNCDCTNADYECDYGYVTDQSDTCIRLHDQEGRIDNVGDYEYYSQYDLIHNPKDDCVNGYKMVSSGYRKVPGDQCVNELEKVQPQKVACTNGTAPSQIPTLAWSITLLNTSTSASMGSKLHFTVKNSKVKWTVRQLGTLHHWEQKEYLPGQIFVSPQQPGAYLVKASKLPTLKNSRSVQVNFWYPIERVTIFRPPVVQVDTDYRVYSTVTIKDGLLGTYPLVGDILYYWSSYKNDQNGQEDIDTKMPSNLSNSAMGHPKLGLHTLELKVKSDISERVTFEDIHVKKCVHLVKLSVNTSALINVTSITGSWITEITRMFHGRVQNVFANDVDKHAEMGFDVYNDTKVFVPPALPIVPQILFYSADGDSPTCDQLKDIASEYDQALNKAFCFKIGTDDKQKQIKVCAETQATSSGVSGGIVVLIIMIICAIVFSSIILYRRYGSSHCSPAYFRVASLRRNASTRSHIVRTRGQVHDDRDPIVDEDEFIDEELDGMETIGGELSNGGNGENGLGTLEFRTG